MCIGGKLRFRLGKNKSGLPWCRVVADNSLDIGLLHQFRPRACNFMDQQVGTGPILDDIMIVACIA